MDLKYSSSSGSEEETEDRTKHIVQPKANVSHSALPKPSAMELIDYTNKLRKSNGGERSKRILFDDDKDMGDIFGLSSKKPKTEVKLERNQSLTRLFNDVRDKKKLEQSYVQNKEVADVGPGIEGGVEITEFDVDKFYNANEKDIEHGQLSAKNQAQGNKMAYHSAGSTRTGLENVIRWNLVNKDKISYQNEVLKKNQKKKAQNKSTY